MRIPGIRKDCRHHIIVPQWLWRLTILNTNSMTPPSLPWLYPALLWSPRFVQHCLVDLSMSELYGFADASSHCEDWLQTSVGQVGTLWLEYGKGRSQPAAHYRFRSGGQKVWEIRNKMEGRESGQAQGMDELIKMIQYSVADSLQTLIIIFTYPYAISCGWYESASYKEVQSRISRPFESDCDANIPRQQICACSISDPFILIIREYDSIRLFIGETEVAVCPLGCKS